MTRRRSIEVAGLQHTHPIPNASQIGPFVMTGSITGKDPGTGQIPTDIEQQCANMFANIERVIQAASGTPADILKLTVWLKNLEDRKHVNPQWLKMFPDAGSRPARHTFHQPDLAGGVLVQCEFFAVVAER